MRFQIANLDYKWMRAIRFARQDKLCHNHCEVGGLAERSNPPFSRSQVGRVDGEGFIIRVPGGSRLQSSDVRAMSELGLSIASDVLKVLGLGEKDLLLLRGPLIAESSL